MILDGLRRHLAHPRAPLRAALLAALLLLPSLGGGLGADDWIQRARLDPASTAPPAAPRGVLMELFTFFPPDAAEHQRLFDAGVLPWWTQPDIRASFMRPVTAVTHMFDWRIIGDQPALHHAHNLVWLAFAVACAGLFLRQWQGATGALAGLIFAVEEAHAFPGAWMANRNALLAMGFGALTGLTHLRAQERGRAWPLATALALALALFSAEAGTGALAVLVALELHAPAQGRLRRLLPAALATAAWVFTWISLGYGVHGSGLYIDPVAHPADFAAQLPERLGALLANAAFNLPIDGWVLVPPGLSLPLGLGLGALAVAAAHRGLGPEGRADPRIREAALLAVLALVPPCGTFPMARLQGIAGLGVAALIARVAAPALKEGASLFSRLALGLHLPLAALMLTAQAAVLPLAFAVTDGVATAMPADMGGRRLVLVQGFEVFTAYIPILRPFLGLPGPDRQLLLAPLATALELSRPDEKTLEIHAPDGAFRASVERLSRSAPFVAGSVVHTPVARIEVLEVDPDGALLRWRATFPVALEHPDLVWRRQSGMGLEELRPPAVGEVLRLGPALPLP